jgi:hypothetical protein
VNKWISDISQISSSVRPQEISIGTMAFVTREQKSVTFFRNNEYVIGGAAVQFDGYFSLRKKRMLFVFVSF